MKQKRPLVLREAYNDLHELESSMYRWDLVFKKISNGNFYGSLNAIDLDSVQLIDARLSGTIFQKGLTPEGYITFAMPAIDSQPFWWHYRNVDYTSLLLFPSTRVLNAISYDGFHVHILSIQKEYFNDLIDKLDLPVIRGQFMDDEKVIPMDKHSVFPLNSLLQALFLKVQFDPDSVLNKSFIRNVQDKIPEMVLNIVHCGLDKINEPIKRERDKMVSMVIDFILSQNLQTLTIQEISSKTGIKQRSLEYAFKEYFQVGPKNFIKALRLNNFRHDLRQSRRSVSETAAKHGFSHLGQLSGDYKLLFGELPSDTLKWVKAMNTS